MMQLVTTSIMLAAYNKPYCSSKRVISEGIPAWMIERQTITERIKGFFKKFKLWRVSHA